MASCTMVFSLLFMFLVLCSDIKATFLVTGFNAPAPLFTKRFSASGCCRHPWGGAGRWCLERKSLHLAVENVSEGSKSEETAPTEASSPPATSEASAETPSSSEFEKASPVSSSSSLPSTSPTSSSSENGNEVLNEIGYRLMGETREVAKCLSIAFEYLMKPDKDVSPQDIVGICDEIETLPTTITDEERILIATQLDLRVNALKFARYELLKKLLRKDYDAYVATASFLSPSRIPRSELPNVQDVPYHNTSSTSSSSSSSSSIPSSSSKSIPSDNPTSEDGQPLVADCTLDDMKYQDSILDKVLLQRFRALVQENTGGVTSPKGGILGLVEQGRTFMLQPGQTPEAQHKMVYDTLDGLIGVVTPVYRIFMTGIIPKLGTDGDNKQIGPWFYAPWLTSVVTPTFFGFLVGPSKPNSRKDGQPGGLLVEKCKFLQESGCKGLCLHQCKLPAQQFFQEELGLPLTVAPNFVTQECQWSFGEVPLPPDKDPSFPKGCLVGCESRKAVAGTYADLCN